MMSDKEMEEGKDAPAEREGVPETTASQPSAAAIKGVLEALIFVSPGGVAARKLADYLECPLSLVSRAAEELAADYLARGSGLAILPVAGGYQMVTSRELAPSVERFLTVVRKKHLSQPALETMAIIAYRQPITRPEVEAIRGVDSSAVINGLLEKKLIRLAGRKKAPGKPLLYATTREFLVHFGLQDLRELPALSELGRPPGQEVEVEEETPHASGAEPDASPANPTEENA